MDSSRQDTRKNIKDFNGSHQTNVPRLFLEIMVQWHEIEIPSSLRALSRDKRRRSSIRDHKHVILLYFMF